MKKSFLIHAGLWLWFGTSGLQAQFLDFSQPARATALGGNLVALPESSSALAFNPAGLSRLDAFAASARYESLFSGLENDDLSTGNLTFLAPAASLGAFGGSWDHLGTNQLQQDRIKAAWGKAFPLGGFAESAALGFSLSYLSQRYSLSSPLAGVSLAGLSSNAFAFGAGFLLSLPYHLTLGVSADDLNRPNLGLVGSNFVPILLRWGLAAQLIDQDSLRLDALASQSFSDNLLETQGGVECTLPKYGLHLRAGAGSYQGSVGFGYEVSGLTIDYAYSFSLFGNSQVSGTGLPGSHLLEVGIRWGGLSDAFAENLRAAREAETAGQWEKALRSYQEGLVLKPADVSALAGRKNALAQLNRARAEDYYQAGLAEEKKGAFGVARDDFEMALNLDPGKDLFSQALKRVDALPGLSKIVATEKVPEGEAMDVADSLQKASELINRGNLKAASKILSEALKRHPRQSILEMVLGDLSPEPAPAKGGKGAASATEQKAQILATESDLYLSKGRPDLAKKNLEEALKAQPQNLRIKQKLVRLEAATQAVSPADLKLAQKLYEQGLQKYLEGDLDGAIRAWEETLKVDPNHTKAQNNLVRAKLEKEAKP